MVSAGGERGRRGAPPGRGGGGFSGWACGLSRARQPSGPPPIPYGDRAARGLLRGAARAASRPGSVGVKGGLHPRGRRGSEFKKAVKAELLPRSVCARGC